MKCEEVQAELVHLHYGEVDDLTLGQLQRHIRGCDRCSAERDALESTLSLTQGAAAPPLPEAVRERLWARVEARQAGLFEALRAVFVPMALGVGTCLISLYPFYHFDMLSHTDPTVVIIGAVVWASIYNSVFTSILHHARLVRLLAPQPVAGQEPVGTVGEPEEAQGVRIQSVIYALLVAFTGLFWAALVVIGPGATRNLQHINTAEAMTGLSMCILGMVGLGVGALEKRQAFTTSTLVAAIFCALGVPALYMISHGQMAPAEILKGTGLLMATCVVATGLGQLLDRSRWVEGATLVRAAASRDKPGAGR